MNCSSDDKHCVPSNVDGAAADADVAVAVSALFSE